VHGTLEKLRTFNLQMEQLKKETAVELGVIMTLET